MPTPFNLPDLDQDALEKIQPQKLTIGEFKQAMETTAEENAGWAKPLVQFGNMLESPDKYAGFVQGPWNAITNLGNALGDKVQGKPIDVSDNYLRISNETARRWNFVGRPTQYLPGPLGEYGRTVTEADDPGMGFGGAIGGETAGALTGVGILKQLQRLAWLKTMAQNAYRVRRLQGLPGWTQKANLVAAANRWGKRSKFAAEFMFAAGMATPFLDQSEGNLSNFLDESLFGGSGVVPFRVEEGDDYLESFRKGFLSEGVLAPAGILGFGLTARKVWNVGGDLINPQQATRGFAEVMDDVARTDIDPYRFGDGGVDTAPVPKPPTPGGDLPPGVQGGDLGNYLDRPGSLSQYDSAISRAIADETQVRQVVEQRNWLEEQGLIEVGENGQWELVVSNDAVNPEIKLMFDRIRKQRGDLIRQATLTGEDLSTQFDELDKMEAELIEAGQAGTPIQMPEGIIKDEFEQLDFPDTRPEMDTFLAQLNELSDTQLREIERKVNLPAMRAAKELRLNTAQEKITQIELKIEEIREKIEKGQEGGGYTQVGGKRQLNKATKELEAAQAELQELQEVRSTETLVGPQIELGLEGNLTVKPPVDPEIPPRKASIEWVNRDKEVLAEQVEQRVEISKKQENVIDVQATRIDEPVREFFTSRQGSDLLPDEVPDSELTPVTDVLAKIPAQTPLRFLIRSAPKSQQAGIAFKRLTDAFEKLAEGAPGGANRTPGLGPVNTVGDFINILNIGRVAIEEGTQKALRDAETTERFRRYVAPYLTKATKLAIKKAIKDIETTKIYFKALELEVKDLITQIIQPGDTIGDIADRIKEGLISPRARADIQRLRGVTEGIKLPKLGSGGARLGVTRKASWDKRLARLKDEPLPGENAFKGWIEGKQRPDPNGPTISEYKNELSRLGRDDLRTLAAPTNNPEIAAIVKARTGRRVWQAKKQDIVDAFGEYYEDTGRWGIPSSPDDVYLEMAADPSDPFILPPGKQGDLNLGDTSSKTPLRKDIDAEGVESVVPVGEYKPRGIPKEEREAIIKSILASAVRNGEIQAPFSPLPERPPVQYDQQSLLADLSADDSGQLSFMYATDQLPTYKAGGKNSDALIDEMRLRYNYQELDASSRQAKRDAFIKERGWDKLPWDEQKRIGMLPESAYAFTGDQLQDPSLGRFIFRDSTYSIKGEDLTGGSVQFSTSNPVEMAARSAGIPYGDQPIPPKKPPEKKVWSNKEVIPEEQAKQKQKVDKEAKKKKGNKRGTALERRESKMAQQDLEAAVERLSKMVEDLNKRNDGGLCS